MRKLLACVLALGGVFVLAIGLNARDREEGKADGPMLVHNVYFTLKDSSAQTKKRLVESCRKHLAGHSGEVFFAVGPRVEERSEPVNDQDFDVALNIVFKSKAAHHAYLVASYHKEFISENRDSFKKVRVFDALAEK